jgi:hypothetical protein
MMEKTLDHMKRLDNESFEDYRERRKAQNEADRVRMRGQFVFISKSKPFIAKGIAGHRDGEVLQATATYRKPRKKEVV